MMKTFFSMALAGLFSCTLMACKNAPASSQTAPSDQTTAVETPTTQPTEQTAQNENPQTRPDVALRVENIYKEVCGAYNKANQMDFSEGMAMLGKKDFDKQFCSKAWHKAVEQVNEKDSQNADEMGFFDFDYWVQGQDFNQLSATDVRVVSIDGDKAVVALNLHNCGEVTPLRLRMVYERGDWFIDDFIVKVDGRDDSLRADMDRYIKN